MCYLNVLCLHICSIILIKSQQADIVPDTTLVSGALLALCPLIGFHWNVPDFGEFRRKREI